MDGKIPFIVFALIIVASLGGFYLTSSLFGGETRAKTYEVGESQTYILSTGGENIGTLTTQIENTTVVEGAKSYVANYLLQVPATNQASWGELKFDEDGNLRRGIAAKAKENSLKWRVEVGYSFKDDLMRVIVEDNRNPENYREIDNLVPLGSENIMLPEHVWYYLRAHDLEEDFQRQIRLNVLPNLAVGPIDPAQNLLVSFKTTGSEKIETPVGNFETWVVEGVGTELARWPIDKLWVSKDEGLVVKALENSKNNPVTYELASMK